METRRKISFTILRFESLASTNTEAIDQAKRGAEEGLCIVADQQTAGRGRRGRIWVSEKQSGLYFSIVLRPQIETKFLPLITLMTAVVVHDALETLYKLNCDIKWANDIYIEGKKICGILAEMTETSKGLAIIVGIGINLNSKNFPAEIAAIATSIAAETEREIDSVQLLAALTGAFQHFYEILQSPNGSEKIVEEWTRRSTYARGKSVRVRLNEESFEGITDGLEGNGALRVKTIDGNLRIVHAGDVTQIRESDFN